MTTEVWDFIQVLGIPLKHYSKSSDNQIKPWVFWDDASSDEHSVQDLLKSAFSNVNVWDTIGLLQFWAPSRTTDLLSVSGPFAATVIETSLAEYRQQSLNTHYNIDVNNAQNKQVLTSGPTAAFFNRVPTVTKSLSDADDLGVSIMVPISLPSEEYDVGVIEIVASEDLGLGEFVLHLIEELKEAGLIILGVQHLMSSKLQQIGDLKHTIEEGLKVLCAAFDLTLAQAWILHDCQYENGPLSLKLAGVINDESDKKCLTYYRLCDEFPKTKLETVLKTFEDHHSRFAPALYSEIVEIMSGPLDYGKGMLCVFVTQSGGGFYVFELVGIDDRNEIENLLTTMNTCLPSFEYGNEGEVIIVEKGSDTGEKMKIFLRKVKSKTGKKGLIKDAVEKEFGNEIRVACGNLGVSETTLRTFVRKIGIPEWPGPRFMRKMQADPSLQIYREKGDKGVESKGLVIHEAKRGQGEDREKGDKRVESKGLVIHEAKRSQGVKSKGLVIHEANRCQGEESKVEESTDEVVTMKAEFGSDKIKFVIPVHEITLEVIKIEIEKRFQGMGSYKVKYLDNEDKVWYLLGHDDDIQEHVKSLKSEKKVVEIRVESKEGTA